MRDDILPHGIATTQFIEDSNRLSDEELMDKYDRSARTIRRWKQWIREKDDEIIASFPESPSPVYDDYLRLNYDRVIVLSDSEIPDHDSQLFEMAARLSDKLEINHLLLNGDILAMDPFSNWPQMDLQRLDFKRDLGLAIKTIKAFLNSFDTVDYIIGNHERRLAKQTKGQSNIGMYCEHILGLQFSNYTYCELTSGGKDILVCHPESFSSTPLAVPRRLAAIHEKNVLCGHSHRICQGFSDSGKYWIGEGGHCRSPERTLYTSMRITNYSKWSSGFALIIMGQLYLITKDNFDFWMRCVDLGR
jgi:predicted phosphodiesterase